MASILSVVAGSLRENKSTSVACRRGNSGVWPRIRCELPAGISTTARTPERPWKEKVRQVVLKHANLAAEKALDFTPRRAVHYGNSMGMEDAYTRCGQICAEYAKTFYLGTLLMTPERRRSIWAIYVWCRRTDELVDGPNSQHITSKALDRWDERLVDLFQGRPYDMYDAVLSHTISHYAIDIQPFRDMVEGMRIDLGKTRYENFDELYLYCYYVAGTVGLMNVPVMGISSTSTMPVGSVYTAALCLGIASQLTNIIRDVGEDARRGRIYLPQDELSMAGLSDDDVFRSRVTNRWRRFMKKQISRARMLFSEAWKGVSELDPASRWAVSASLMLYKNILDFVEANDYDNFTRRASVCGIKKLLLLPRAYIMCGRPLSHFEYFLLQPDHNQQSHVL